MGLSDRVALKEIVRQVLSRLPEKQRTVLLLHTVEGFSGNEISDILGISHETVRTRLFRARQMLSKSVSMKTGQSVLREEAS